MAGVNGLFLGSVMYRSRLVPRIIPTIGLLGAPIILFSGTVTLFGGWDEISLGLWLTVKGFRPAAVAALGSPRVPAPLAQPLA